MEKMDNVKNIKGKNHNSLFTNIIEWVKDYLVLIGAISIVMAIIGGYMEYLTPRSFNGMFPSLQRYYMGWFVYGSSTAMLMALLMYLKKLVILFRLFSSLIVKICSIKISNAEKENKDKGLIKSVRRYFGLRKGRLTLEKLDGKTTKGKASKLDLKVPTEILPETVFKGKGKMMFNINEYESMVKTAFLRVGIIKESELTEIKVHSVKEGPRAIQINISLPYGMTVSLLKSKTEDLRHAFDAPSFQIESGKAGRALLTVFLKDNVRPVLLREVLEAPEVSKFIHGAQLPIIVGVNPIGDPILFDLVDGPHILVAGATQSGKTWWIIQLLFLFLMKHSPEELAIWIVDPKMVDFKMFKEIPHVECMETEIDKAVELLNQAVQLMEYRYRMIEASNCRNIKHYNQKNPKNKMKYIVIVIDEIADLILQSREQVEVGIARLAQKSRACGIHLVNATQRPSVKIISGDIKANLISRISFKLKTQADYRTVFDNGIEMELQGKGDGMADLEGFFGYKRFQSPAVGKNDLEIDQAMERLIRFWKDKNGEKGNQSVYQNNKKIPTDPKGDEGGVEIDPEIIPETHQFRKITFLHGKKKEYKKVVPTCDFKAGTAAEAIPLTEKKVVDEYLDSVIEEEYEIEPEGSDIDAYHRREILKLIRQELLNNQSREEVYAPSANQLSQEIGIRKSTVLEHLADLQKESALTRHPNRRYIINIDEDELQQLIEDLDKHLLFIKKKRR